jgi:hypothetical protein
MMILEGSMPVWEQLGITSPAEAGAFLEALRRRDVLVLPSADGDRGYPIVARGQQARGWGVAVSATVVAASLPPPDLLAYHRSLGLGPERVFHPARASARDRLARLTLDDADLISALRADGTLRHGFVAFKDRDAERLLERLCLDPLYCGPPAAAYEAANDKLSFAEAGTTWGFDALPTVPAGDETSLVAAFRALSARWREGCIVRGRRGAGGNEVYHVRSEHAARRIWRRLAASRRVIVAPYVPRATIVRDVATHGIVTRTGFAPLAFADQLVRGCQFRGGRVTHDWPPEHIAAVAAGLDGIARWLRDLGYVDAPAGIDGFLVRRHSTLRFLAVDPNVRMTGTMMPWAVVAALSERVRRRFVWQVETFHLLGVTATFDRLRRRLGADLLDAESIERGGILPSMILSTVRLGSLGASLLTAILLAHDITQLDRLRGRILRLGIVVR